MQSLVHELNVHQIELEMQNEELRQSQHELAHSRDRYSDLYDFAPVGYVTLDKDGRILEANLTAATFLGVDRKSLIAANLSTWIDHDAQDDFFLHRRAVFSDSARQICEVNMHRSGGTPLAVRLESIAQETGHQRQSRTALIDITQQQVAQSTLRQLTKTQEHRIAEQTSEVRLLAEAISHLGEGVLITDDDLNGPGPRIRFVNKAMCRISGYTAEELIGQSQRILQGDKTSEATWDYIRREMAANRACSVELTNYRKDGTPYEAELFITTILDAAGDRTNFVSIHRDITKQKQAEKELRDSESMKSAILCSLAAHIAVIDRDGTIVSVNPAWEEFARSNGGSDLRCSVGANYLEVCKEAAGESADEATRVAAGLQAILDGNSAEFSLEYPCHSTAEQRWFLVHATPLQPKELGAVVSHTNITHRVKAEQALRESEVRLRAILNAACDAIVNIDCRGNIIDVNPATVQMFGYTQDELVGQNVKILMPSPYHEEHDGYIARYLETGEARIIGIGGEAVGRRKNGSTFAIALAVSKVDHLGLFTGSIRDISERQKLHRDVLSIAEEERRRIGQDLHDSTQQELAGLGMLAQTLFDNLAKETDHAPKGSAAKHSELARKIVDGIARTHREVQTVSRGLVPFRLENEGFMDALRRLALRTDELEGVTCAFKCEQPVEVPDSVIATNLYRIAQEAVTNTLKHGRAEHILIALESDNGQPILKVADDGTGFDVKEQTEGMGLKTMRYRASLIGARLTIEPVDTGGTLVTCKVHVGAYDDK